MGTERLTGNGWEILVIAAARALHQMSKHPVGVHPSRELIELLIKDGEAWLVLYDEWKQLVTRKAQLKVFVGLLGSDGSNAALKAELASDYKIRGGAADQICLALRRLGASTWRRSLCLCCLCFSLFSLVRSSFCVHFVSRGTSDCFSSVSLLFVCSLFLSAFVKKRVLACMLFF